MHEMHIMFLN